MKTMLYEYYIIKRIIALIETGRVLSDLSLEEKKDFSKVILDKSVDINELEAEIKKLVNFLAIKYGLLEALKKIKHFRDDLIELRVADIPETSFLSLPSNDLYKELEKYYMPDVMQKLYTAISNMGENRFDENSFLKTVIRPSIPVKRALGLTVGLEGDQTSLFTDTDVEKDVMAEKRRAIDFRDRFMKELCATLKMRFSNHEISAYCGKIVDVLSNSPLVEHKIIQRVITQSIAPQFFKPTNSTNPTPDDQISLFAVPKRGLRDERYGTRLVYRKW